jgi:segregation and condensation protein A
LLLARLLDCKTFKDVASVFTQLAEQASLSYPRRSGPDERFADLMPDMLEGVTVVRLQRAFLRATQPKPPTAIDWYHVAPIRASVADALMEMLETLPKLGKVTFKQITEAIHDRIEVVVRFLAILELFKQGRISLEQTDRFGDIEVMWTAGDDTGFVSVMQIDDYEG